MSDTRSSSSGTTTGYVVEARSTGPAKPFGAIIIDGQWRQLPVYDDAIGIPNRIFGAAAKEAGLLSFSCAMALMAWAESVLGWGSGVVFRLARRKVKWTWNVEDDGVSEPTNYFELERSTTFTAEEPSDV